MAGVNFSAILQNQASAIEKPKPLPIGSYICTNPALPEFKELGQNKTPCAEFSLKVMASSDDVDPEQLAEFGDYKGKNVRHRMFLSENSLFRSKEELVKAFALEEEGKNLGQLFNETVNKQVLVTIKHTPTQDGTDIYAEVEGIAAV